MDQIQITEETCFPSGLLDHMNDFLSKKDTSDLHKRGETFWSFTYKFSDGTEADMKVVSGDGPYVDPVLYNAQGQELCIGEVSDSITGEFVWITEHVIYTLVVKAV